MNQLELRSNGDPVLSRVTDVQDLGELMSQQLMAVLDATWTEHRKSFAQHLKKKKMIKPADANHVAKCLETTCTALVNGIATLFGQNTFRISMCTRLAQIIEGCLTDLQQTSDKFKSSIEKKRHGKKLNEGLVPIVINHIDLFFDLQILLSAKLIALTCQTANLHLYQMLNEDGVAAPVCARTKQALEATSRTNDLIEQQVKWNRGNPKAGWHAQGMADFEREINLQLRPLILLAGFASEIPENEKQNWHTTLEAEAKKIENAIESIPGKNKLAANYSVYLTPLAELMESLDPTQPSYPGVITLRKGNVFYQVDAVHPPTMKDALNPSVLFINKLGALAERMVGLVRKGITLLDVAGKDELFDAASLHGESIMIGKELTALFTSQPTNQEPLIVHIASATPMDLASAYDYMLIQHEANRACLMGITALIADDEQKAKEYFDIAESNIAKMIVEPHYMNLFRCQLACAALHFFENPVLAHDAVENLQLVVTQCQQGMMKKSDCSPLEREWLNVSIQKIISLIIIHAEQNNINNEARADLINLQSALTALVSAGGQYAVEQNEVETEPPVVVIQSHHVNYHSTAEIRAACDEFHAAILAYDTFCQKIMSANNADDNDKPPLPLKERQVTLISLAHALTRGLSNFVAGRTGDLCTNEYRLLDSLVSENQRLCLSIKSLFYQYKHIQASSGVVLASAKFHLLQMVLDSWHTRMLLSNQYANSAEKEIGGRIPLIMLQLNTMRQYSYYFCRLVQSATAEQQTLKMSHLQALAKFIVSDIKAYYAAMKARSSLNATEHLAIISFLEVILAYLKEMKKHHDVFPDSASAAKILLGCEHALQVLVLHYTDMSTQLPLRKLIERTKALKDELGRKVVVSSIATIKNNEASALANLVSDYAIFLNDADDLIPTAEQAGVNYRDASIYAVRIAQLAQYRQIAKTMRAIQSQVNNVIARNSQQATTEFTELLTLDHQLQARINLFEFNYTLLVNNEKRYTNGVDQQFTAREAVETQAMCLFIEQYFAALNILFSPSGVLPSNLQAETYLSELTQLAADLPSIFLLSDISTLPGWAQKELGKMLLATSTLLEQCSQHTEIVVVLDQLRRQLQQRLPGSTTFRPVIADSQVEQDIAIDMIGPYTLPSDQREFTTTLHILMSAVAETKAILASALGGAVDGKVTQVSNEINDDDDTALEDALQLLPRLSGIPDIGMPIWMTNLHLVQQQNMLGHYQKFVQAYARLHVALKLPKHKNGLTLSRQNTIYKEAATLVRTTPLFVEQVHFITLIILALHQRPTTLTLVACITDYYSDIENILLYDKIGMHSALPKPLQQLLSDSIDQTRQAYMALLMVNDDTDDNIQQDEHLISLPIILDALENHLRLQEQQQHLIPALSANQRYHKKLTNSYRTEMTEETNETPIASVPARSIDFARAQHVLELADVISLNLTAAFITDKPMTADTAADFGGKVGHALRHLSRFFIEIHAMDLLLAQPITKLTQLQKQANGIHQKLTKLTESYRFNQLQNNVSCLPHIQLLCTHLRNIEILMQATCSLMQACASTLYPANLSTEIILTQHLGNEFCYIIAIPDDEQTLPYITDALENLTSLNHTVLYALSQAACAHSQQPERQQFRQHVHASIAMMVANAEKCLKLVQFDSNDYLKTILCDYIKDCHRINRFWGEFDNLIVLHRKDGPYAPSNAQMQKINKIDPMLINTVNKLIRVDQSLIRLHGLLLNHEISSEELIKCRGDVHNLLSIYQELYNEFQRDFTTLGNNNADYIFRLQDSGAIISSAQWVEITGSEIKNKAKRILAVIDELQAPAPIKLATLVQLPGTTTAAVTGRARSGSFPMATGHPVTAPRLTLFTSLSSRPNRAAQRFNEGMADLMHLGQIYSK